MDFNIMNKVPLDVRVRYIKSFNLPQQLGEGSVKIHPGYLQIYFGLGISFGVFKDRDRSDDDESGSRYEDS